MSSTDRHPSRRAGRPARLTIDVVEGRGIWVEIHGDLTNGSSEQVEARLGRLARLGFEIVIVGTSGVRTIDVHGSRLLGRFVDGVCDRRGSVLIVDPHGRCAAAGDLLVRATLTQVPPTGAWWLG